MLKISIPRQPNIDTRYVTLMYTNPPFQNFYLFVFRNLGENKLTTIPDVSKNIKLEKLLV